MRNILRKIRAPLGLSMVLAAGAASAQTTATYGDILTGLDSAPMVAALISAGTILAAVGFSKWGAKKLGRFFG